MATSRHKTQSAKAARKAQSSPPTKVAFCILCLESCASVKMVFASSVGVVAVEQVSWR